MTEPTTAAGRRLLADIAALTEYGQKPYLPADSQAILAIEAEAREQERARIRAAVEKMKEFPGKSIVVAVIGDVLAATEQREERP